MLLWTHEASHFSLFRERRFNDIWCDLFLSGPIGISVASYRNKHMTHHAHLGSNQDQDSYPYRFDIKGSAALARVMALTLTGALGLWLIFEKYLKPLACKTVDAVNAPHWVAPMATIAFNGTLLGLCILSGHWYLYFLLWVYPIIAVAITLNVIRTVAEHQPEDFPKFRDGAETAMRPVARTTVPNWLEKWMLYQANFNYHIEHHLYPAVPQHNLAHLHRRLVDGGFYRRFPGLLQRSGIAKFLVLARNRNYNDFSDPVNDAVRS